MAPGPPKGKGNSKAKSRGLSVDFKKVKTKVGRKLPQAQNATKVEFKARGIVVPGQSVAQDKEGLAVNQRKQTLKELLAQSTHYSERTRKDSLMGLKDLFVKHPKELIMHAVVVIEKLAPRITDLDKNVRQALVLLLRSAVLPHLPQAMMKPLVPVIMAHVCSAMTHLVLDLRIAACTFLDLLMDHCSNLIVPFFSGQIVQHFTGLLGKGGISGQAGSRLVSVLTSLEHFLSALKQSTMAQPSGASVGSSLTHRWGVKYDTSQQGIFDGLRALHGYKSLLPEGNPTVNLSIREDPMHQKRMEETSTTGEAHLRVNSRQSQRVQNTGRSGQIGYTATPLLPVLLECWAESAPMVCTGPTPDGTRLESMVVITKCLCHILQTITSEAAPFSSGRDSSAKYSAIHVPEYGSEEWEIHLWMQQQFLPGLCQHLLNFFPCTAPAVRLPPKVEEGLVALNIGVCEIMLQFLPCASQGMKMNWIDPILQCIEDALYGIMLPPSDYAAGLSDPKLSERHVKELISYIPGIVKCAPEEWVVNFLQAFTKVFESCNSRSNTKLVCLSSMSELLLPGRKLGGRRKVLQTSVPAEFLSQWLQSLPKLLWELKDTYPNLSQAVLEMLLHIGRSSSEGSALDETYNGLQQAMMPFFCSFLVSKQSDESRCLYGPFVKLPKACQELAADLLYYYTNFSSLFLKVLAQCCLCPDLDVTVAVRVVEVLQTAFSRGAIGLAEHLSFLLTLLLGRIPSEGGKSRKASAGRDVEVTGHDKLRNELELETQERHNALTGVICTCLGQTGDGHLLLSILGPSLRQELEKHGNLGVLHRLFRVVAVLSHKDQTPDGVFLPDPLIDLLPKYAVDFLIAINLMNDGNLGATKESVLKNLKRPCFVLLARSSNFTRMVLTSFHEFLLKEVDQPVLRHQKQCVASAHVVLEMLKLERLERCLSSSKDIIKAVLKTIEIQGDIHTSEGRELKRLHEQLQTATNAVFGVEFATKRKSPARGNGERIF